MVELWPDPATVVNWPPLRDLDGRPFQSVSYRFGGKLPPPTLKPA